MQRSILAASASRPVRDTWSNVMDRVDQEGNGNQARAPRRSTERGGVGHRAALSWEAEIRQAGLEVARTCVWGGLLVHVARLCSEPVPGDNGRAATMPLEGTLFNLHRSASGETGGSSGHSDAGSRTLPKLSVSSLSLDTFPRKQPRSSLPFYPVSWDRCSRDPRAPEEGEKSHSSAGGRVLAVKVALEASSAQKTPEFKDERPIDELAPKHTLNVEPSKAPYRPSNQLLCQITMLANTPVYVW